MAIIQRKKKDGSLSYLVRVQDNCGKWFPALTFGSLNVAKAEELRLIDLKQKGGKSIGDDAKKYTVREFWEVWSIENRQNVSEGWKKSQNQMYRNYIDPVLGKRALITIGAPEIGKVLNQAKSIGRSDNTILLIYGLLRRMFGDAVGYYEILTKNPVNPKFHRPKINLPERKFLKPLEAKVLLEVSKDHFLGPAIWVQLLTGIRPGEMQALIGKHLLFELNQILICSTYNRKIGKLQNFTKAGGSIYVPMTPLLKGYLKARLIKDDQFVCSGLKGGMLEYGVYLSGLTHLCQRAGLPRVTPHELRHSCTELWVQAGASAEDIRRLLNHKSMEVTKRYMHRTDNRLGQISTLVSEALQDSTSFTKNFTNVKKQAELAAERECQYVN